jgi:hypothetical protein
MPTVKNKELIDVYKNLTLTSLRVVVWDMLRQYESLKWSKDRDIIKLRVSLPISIFIKYNKEDNTELLDYCIKEEIKVDLSYSHISYD